MLFFKSSRARATIILPAEAVQQFEIAAPEQLTGQKLLDYVCSLLPQQGLSVNEYAIDFYRDGFSVHVFALKREKLIVHLKKLSRKVKIVTAVGCEKKINFLPWREQREKKRWQIFLGANVLILVAVISISSVFIVRTYSHKFFLDARKQVFLRKQEAVSSKLKEYRAIKRQYFLKNTKQLRYWLKQVEAQMPVKVAGLKEGSKEIQFTLDLSALPDKKLAMYLIKKQLQEHHFLLKVFSEKNNQLSVSLGDNYAA